MSIELKIKSKHLAEEAKIIRSEENKLRKSYRRDPELKEKLLVEANNLSTHRRWDVRNEQRATYLARAYIAGKNYSDLERNCDIWFRSSYIDRRVKTMVEKYSDLEFDPKWFLT